MANEILSVPELHLREVIRVIRTGLEHEQVSDEVCDQLRKWCNEEERYINDQTTEVGK